MCRMMCGDLGTENKATDYTHFTDFTRAFIRVIREIRGVLLRPPYGGNDMKLWWRVTLGIAGLAVLWSGFALVDPAAAQGQTAASTTRRKAGEAFKNVTTSTLKELSVDDFL